MTGGGGGLPPAWQATTKPGVGSWIFKSNARISLQNINQYQARGFGALDIKSQP